MFSADGFVGVGPNTKEQTEQKNRVYLIGRRHQLEKKHIHPDTHVSYLALNHTVTGDTT